MGRNRDSYWECRRALQRRRWSWTPRVYGFDKEAVIFGERGRVCLEPILTPPKDTPLASWRVIARWTGVLPPESVVTVADQRLIVLRVRAMGVRRTVAHILCGDAPAE